jgi:hypothetical protein
VGEVSEVLEREWVCRLIVRKVGVLTLEETAEGEEEGGHFCV